MSNFRGRMSNYLFELLKPHIGHAIEIVAYGDAENPDNIAIEDLDTCEVIIDTTAYEVVGIDEIEGENE